MKTAITEMFDIEHPIIQGGMHYVGYAVLAAAVSNAGGLGILTGLSLSGYATIDSFFTDSMPGYWRDGFFRVYRAEEPIRFWIYRSLCVAGTLV